MAVVVVLTLMVCLVQMRDNAVIHRSIVDCSGSNDCYASLIAQRTGYRDLEAVFRIVGMMYADSPTFRPQCHSFSLDLTKELYERNTDPSLLILTPDIIWCNYGFLQQYPASMLADTKDVRSAQAFCDRVGRSIGTIVPGAEAECYRGIGRGLPFVDTASQGDPVRMAAYGVQICKDITPDATDRGTCLSGVFNIIGRAETDPSSDISIETSNPMNLCKIQEDAEAQGRCFGNFKATVISMVPVDDTRSAERDILTLYGDSASTTATSAMWTLGYEWGRTKIVAGERFRPAIAACMELSAPYIHDCIQGVSVGIAKHGIPGAQHILMTAFCRAARASIPSLAASDCPSLQAIGYIRGFYRPAVFDSAYAAMKWQLGTIAQFPNDDPYGF